jgi:hypothetical protein
MFTLWSAPLVVVLSRWRLLRLWFVCGGGLERDALRFAFLGLGQKRFRVSGGAASRLGLRGRSHQSPFIKQTRSGVNIN